VAKRKAACLSFPYVPPSAELGGVKMNERDRVKIAFQFKESERVPYCSYLNDEQKQRLTEYYGSEDWKTMDNDHLYKIYAVDHYLRANGVKTRENGRIITDCFGCTWELGNVHHLIDAPLKEDCLNGYKLPDINEFYKKHADAYIRKEIEKSAGKFRVVQHTFGLFERAWSLRGFENFLMDLSLNPKFCEELIEMIADWIIESVDNILRHPVDAVMLTDDYADQRGIIFGPEKFKKYFKPHWKRILSRIKKAGVYSILHVCGNAEPAIPDLIECGLDCIESLQPEAMDIYRFKKEYGNDIRMWGGIGIQKLMTFGSTKDVKNEVKKLKTELNKGGGYILAPTKEFNSMIPVENIAAYIEEASKSI